MTSRYPWILTRPRRGGRPSRKVPSRPCPKCGYDPVTGRKKCPACFAVLEETQR